MLRGPAPALSIEGMRAALATRRAEDDRRAPRPSKRLTEADWDLADALLEESRVALTPGEAFDAPGFIRISYATSIEILREGSRRLLDFVAAHTQSQAAAS